LGNDYIALHNITMPETEVNIPLMVIGPTGVYVLYVTPLAGVYRAKGDNWLIQESGRGMRNAHPNLLARSQLMGRAVEVFLKRNGCDVTVQTALLCSSSKMFVESIRPSTRVIMSDAIEKFITSWAQENANLNADVVHQIADLLTTQPKPVAPAVVEPVAAEGQPIVQPAASKPSGFEAAFGKINFTTRQWILMGVLLALLVCVLLTFIAIVLFAK
jgi:hypothetical protein